MSVLSIINKLNYNFSEIIQKHDVITKHDYSDSSINTFNFLINQYRTSLLNISEETTLSSFLNLSWSINPESTLTYLNDNYMIGLSLIVNPDCLTKALQLKDANIVSESFQWKLNIL